LPVSGSTSTSQNWLEKPGAMPPGIDRCRGGDRAAGQGLLRGELPERQWRKIADITAPGLRLTVLPDHTFNIDIPNHRRAGAQLVDDLLAGLDNRHAGGKGDARPAGHEGVADRRGVGDDRAYLIVVDPQGLGRHQCHRGARAADIGAAGHDLDVEPGRNS